MFRRWSLFAVMFFLSLLIGSNVSGQTCQNSWLSLPAYNSYVSVGDLDVPGNTITVEAIFIRTAPYTNGDVWAGDLVSKHNNPPDINYLLRPNSAEITTSVNGYVRTPPVCEIELHKVYHVAMVYDGSMLKFYRNGFLMSSVAASGTLYQNDFNTRIGLYDALVHNTQMIGYVNEVRIWNIARTQAQIRAFMSTSLPNPTTQTGLVAYYTFDNLLNKQGNATWNGVLGGPATINNTVPSPNCNLVIDSCSLKPPSPSDSLIINDYTAVLEYSDCSNSLKVKDAGAFKAGDTVLMIQMKGASMLTADNNLWGTFISMMNSGNFEYNLVEAVNGDKIELKYALLRPYTFAGGKVQLVRVPYYQSLSTDKILTCLPWDGEKGGVLAFRVQNDLVMNKDIDVSGRGFRGGAAVYNANGICGVTDFVTTVVDGSRSGLKGETAYDNIIPWAGRNNQISGGGGGNGLNAGGGGGANGGFAGKGGFQSGICPPADIGGLGGMASATNSLTKIYPGGGGGAGQQNAATGAGGGGNGGGIVIISAGSLQTNSFKIRSVGDTPEPVAVANPVGRGGGGAGGSVLLDCSNLLDNVGISVKGGDGGSNPGAALVGPGGGGSGGIVALSAPAILPLLTLDLAGGVAGKNIPANDVRGAGNATAGSVNVGFVMPLAAAPSAANIGDLKIDTIRASCMAFDFKGSAAVKTYPIVSWSWDFGDGTTASTQDASHTFTQAADHTVKLVVADDQGCRDSVTLTAPAVALDLDFSYKVDVCNPVRVEFTPEGSTGNAYWDFGDGNELTGVTAPAHIFPGEGDHTVQYSIAVASCSDTISKIIHLGVAKENIVITPDTTICAGTTKLLRTQPALRYCWFPTIWLNDPTLAQPTTSAEQDITYYFTAEVMGTNLITNGDFSQGNVGFASFYSHNNPNTTEGQYTIGTDPSSWNGSLAKCTDHTSGSGNMMLVNGAPQTDVTVWQQTIPVVPGTDYAFAIWIQSLSPQNPAKLQFSINGQQLAAPINAGALTCQWQQFYVTWNASSSTSAQIAIINKNNSLAGNDFALDDISFAPISIKRDSVTITVDKPLVKAANDTIICMNRPVNLNAGGAVSYTWSPATGLSDVSAANPVASPSVSTEYIVAGVNANGCVAKDTVQVNVFAKPLIVHQADTSVCRNTSLPLWITGGVSYHWTSPGTISDPFSANPVVSPVGETRYDVLVTDHNNCVYADSVTVGIIPDPVFGVNGEVAVCINDSVALNAFGGDQYVWSPAAGMNDAGIASPKVSPAVTTDYTVTITEQVCNRSAVLSTTVTVLPLPDVRATSENNIDCSYGSSQLGASGARTYSWSPAAGLNNASIFNPLAIPASTTVFVVKGTDRNGCAGYDSVLVKVENINKGGYEMPSAFTPNSDGLNDCYGIKFWGVIGDIEFSVFDRWGNRLFYSKDPRACWDGTFKGQKQATGVYVYMIRANTNCEAPVFRKGTFTLVR